MSCSEESMSFDDGKGRKKAMPLNQFEKELLFELVRDNKIAIECKKSDIGTIQRKQKAWDTIAKNFCGQLGTTKRNAQQLKKCWENAKRSTRKNKSITSHSNQTKLTSGGPPQGDLSVDEMIASIISGTASDQIILEKRTGRAIDVSDCNSKTKRKSKPGQPSLSSIEYDEHKGRMKTISMQQEYQMLQIKIAKRQLEIMEEQHILKSNLLTAQLSSLSNVEILQIKNT